LQKGCAAKRPALVLYAERDGDERVFIPVAGAQGGQNDRFGCAVKEFHAAVAERHVRASHMMAVDVAADISTYWRAAARLPIVEFGEGLRRP
jgi:hypothetical protein